MELATVPYATTIEHDGRSYHVEIPDLTVPPRGALLRETEETQASVGEPRGRASEREEG
jgi:hypothetical protein